MSSKDVRHPNKLSNTLGAYVTLSSIRSPHSWKVSCHKDPCYVRANIDTVMDDDANGLIKIKEVNEFTASRPEGISLMEWIAYSAYGIGSNVEYASSADFRDRVGR